MANSSHEKSTEPLHIWLHVRSGLLGVIFIITLVLNTLLIIVLRKMKSRRSKTDSACHNIEKAYMYLLFHLAFSDMLGVLLNIPFGILENAGIDYNLHPVSCTLLPPLQLASTSAQAGTYVALSYHRFRAIVYPIRVNLTVCKSILMIFIIWTVGFCLSLPYAIVIRLTENGCEEVWPQGLLSSNVYTFAIFIVQYAAPVTLMAIFYVSIAKTLQEHRNGKDLGNSRAEEDIRTHRHIVKMLVTIVSVYSVCMLPHHLLWIIDGLRPMGRYTFKISSQVSYLFTYSNTVANPAVFFLYNKESRLHLKRIFRKFCCWRSKLSVPFNLDVNMMWSGSWSAHSKSDNNNRSEKNSFRTDRLKLNQLFPTHPAETDLGVSLPWEAQVLSTSPENLEDVQEYGVTPYAPDSFCRMDPEEYGEKAALSAKERTNETRNETAGNGDNFKMDDISEEDEQSISEDEAERVQNLIKAMVVDIKRDMSNDTLYDGDMLSSEDIPSSWDIPNNEDILSNDHIVSNAKIVHNGDIPHKSSSNADTKPQEDTLNNGDIGKNEDMLGSAGNYVNCSAFDDDLYDEFKTLNEVDNEKSSYLEGETDNRTTSPQDLVKDMINFLENSPSHLRDINDLREHLWSLPEDDV